MIQLLNAKQGSHSGLIGNEIIYSGKSKNIVLLKQSIAKYAPRLYKTVFLTKSKRNIPFSFCAYQHFNQGFNPSLIVLGIMTDMIGPKWRPVG